MKSSKLIASIAIILALAGTARTLHAQSPCVTIRPVSGFKGQAAQTAGLLIRSGAVAALQKGQNGYWARLVRAASVRDYPKGKPIVRDGKPVILKAGQWFHLDPGVGTAAWALGYCCPDGSRGGKGCNKQSAVAGFILRAALSTITSARRPSAALPLRAALSLLEMRYARNSARAGLVAGLFNHFNAAGAALVPSPGQERRICSREAWFRDDKLHRIGILRKGDSLIVERYTNGTQKDKQRRWAIGRGVGRGIQPNRSLGRVLVTSLCP